MNEKTPTPKEAAAISEETHAEFNPDDNSKVYNYTNNDGSDLYTEFSRRDIAKQINNLRYDIEHLELVKSRINALSLEEFDSNTEAKAMRCLATLRGLGVIKEEGEYEYIRVSLQRNYKEGADSKVLFEELMQKINQRSQDISEALKNSQAFSEDVEKLLEEERLPEIRQFEEEHLDQFKKAAFAEALLDGKDINLSPEDEVMILGRKAAQDIVSRDKE